MDSRDEVLSKIKTYQNQLTQVKEFLKSDPANEQFIQLENDLIQAIHLTNNLLENVNASGLEDLEDSEEDDLSDVDDDDQNPFLRATLPQKTGEIAVGDIIEVVGNDRPYAGIVESIDKSNETCVIKYFEYSSTTVTLPIKSIARISPGIYTFSEIQPGFKCMCKYSQDQKLYEVEVNEVLPHGVRVTYIEYGNSEEVPIQYLSPLKPEKTKKDKNRDDKTGPDKGLIPIPEKLKILPTDTEQEKQRKRKKLKAIKNHNKKVSQEIEIQETQQSWKKFVQKGSKRPFSGIAKQSIFATTDDVNGKVGVVNSGKGLTDFVQRKKNRFEALP